MECLILGSTLSATDPVTILAIFNTFKVDPKLYSVIFGESILNDAVSIVLYETLSQFHGADLKMSSFFRGAGIFFLSFSGSMALGVTFALACSLGLKHSKVGSFPGIESCLVSLIAYTSYFFSNGIGMSGLSAFHSFILPFSFHSRYRVSHFLRYHSEALCLPQYEYEDTTNYQIHVSCPCATLRKLHFCGFNGYLRQFQLNLSRSTSVSLFSRKMLRNSSLYSSLLLVWLSLLVDI